MTPKIGHLVVTLSTGDNGESLMLMAHTEDGPVPVYVEIAEHKACRCCGATAARCKIRFVGDTRVGVKRTKRERTA